MEEEYSDVEEHEELEELQALNDLFVQNNPNTRRVYLRMDLFTLFADDEDFRFRFRLPRFLVVSLYSRIEHKLLNTKRNNAVAPMNRLLLTLRIYATGAFLGVGADMINMANTTAGRIFHKVTKHICEEAVGIIKFPKTEEELNDVSGKFFQRGGLPGVIGLIDCTHVPIISPGGDFAEVWRNRKGFFSFNVQAIVNYDLMFTDVVARWQGSCHDSTIFDNCHKRAVLETDQRYSGRYLLGDGAYQNRSYIITPVLDPDTPAKQLFNQAHIVLRNRIERTFGVYKRRFPICKLGLRFKIGNSANVVVATMTLHNLCMMVGDDVPPELDVAVLAGFNNYQEVPVNNNNGPLTGEEVRNALIALFA